MTQDPAGREFKDIRRRGAAETEGAEHFPSLIAVRPFNVANSCAESINYNRAIVGYYFDSQFMRRGFLAIPQ